MSEQVNQGDSDNTTAQACIQLKTWRHLRAFALYAHMLQDNTSKLKLS